MGNVFYGIDFGACYIKVSKYDSNKDDIRQIQLERDQHNQDCRITNVIGYSSVSNFYVGELAKKNKNLNSSDFIIDKIKRKLEENVYEKNIQVFDDYFSISRIVIDIFKWIKTETESKGENILDVAITVPVCFSEIQKRIVEKSAKDAGLPVSKIITEPVAALFSCELDYKEPQNILVFDFGGATLDLCLVKLEKDDDETNIEIMSSYGINLGGIDITKLIYEEIIYKKYSDFIENHPKKEIVKINLLDMADDIKSKIFSDEYDDVQDFYTSPDGSGLDIEVTVDEVSECLEKFDLKGKIISALDNLFEDIDDCKNEDVTDIKLFGGSSRIELAQNILKEYFDKRFNFRDYDSDVVASAVADGAAKYLGIVNDKSSTTNIHQSLSYCVKIKENDEFKTVIEKNAKYGCIYSKYFDLSKLINLSKKWEVPLYQSFSSNDANAVYIGKMVLTESKYTNFKAVLCRFKVDKSGKIIGSFDGLDEQNNLINVENIDVIN